MKIILNIVNVWIVVPVCILLMNSGCDHGISPSPSPPYGVSGTITFVNWPPLSEVVDLRVVLFKSYPTQNIVLDVLQGKAKYSASLGNYGALSLSYSLIVSPMSPGKYEYLVVAQQFGPDVFNDWRVVGEYSLPPDSGHPSSVMIPSEGFFQHADMIVNFYSNPLVGEK